MLSNRERADRTYWEIQRRKKARNKKTTDDFYEVRKAGIKRCGGLVIDSSTRAKRC